MELKEALKRSTCKDKAAIAEMSNLYCVVELYGSEYAIKTKQPGARLYDIESFETFNALEASLSERGWLSAATDWTPIGADGEPMQVIHLPSSQGRVQVEELARRAAESDWQNRKLVCDLLAYFDKKPDLSAEQEMEQKCAWHMEHRDHVTVVGDEDLYREIYTNAYRQAFRRYANDNDHDH